MTLKSRNQFTKTVEMLKIQSKKNSRAQSNLMTRNSTTKTHSLRLTALSHLDLAKLSFAASETTAPDKVFCPSKT